MKIAVNTRLLLPNRIDGIARFTFETLKLITQKYPEHQFYFFFDRPFSDEFIFSENIIPIVIGPQARHPFLFYWWFEFSISKQLKKIKPDLFLSPDGFLSLNTNVKSLPVIHDINFVHYKKNIPWLVSKYYNYFFPKFAKKASRIVTVSNFSAKDISMNFGIDSNKIDVVFNGVSDIFKPINDELIKQNTRQKYSESKQFFIAVSSIHPRKNIAGLLKAFNQFKTESNNEHKLILVGDSYFWDKEMTEQLKQMDFKKDVVFTGKINDEELAKLMASASAMLYVPFFEGFGIPILEAFKSEIPVISSNTSSLPEVYGDAALAVNPSSTNEIAEAMQNIVNNNELRNNLVEKGKIQLQKYSWQKTADLLWQSMLKTINNA
ncbi:MAG: glycosyltransferase family 1 protein [Bacteroidota bacterium]